MSRFLRSVVGLCLLLIGWVFVVESVPWVGNSSFLVPGVLMGITFGLAGACLLTPTLAAWAATPFTHFIDQIYFPSGRSTDRPRPHHRLAEYYFLDAQWDLAVEEYQKILRYHPRELRAYLALLDIHANELNQPERAARLFRRGVRKIRDSDQLHRLQEAYRHGVVEKFKPPPREPDLLPDQRVSSNDVQGGADAQLVEG